MTSECDHDHHRHGDPDVVMDQAFWDERYRSSDALWSRRPNAQLVAEAAGLAPGLALDVGCGEGADARWLAAGGWRVIAVDLSPVALERAAAGAVEAGAEAAQRITWQQADILEWVPEPGAYDLVSAQFLQLRAEQRQLVHRRLAKAVAPGGSLLVVGHDVSDLETGIRRPATPELFFTGSDVAATLAPDEWTIVVNEARTRATAGPDGTTVIIRDAVLRAERTA